MFRIFFFFFLIICPIKAIALIEVDITRGNLNPLPIAVSPLSIDEKSKESFKKILNKENIGLEISSVVEKNLKTFAKLSLKNFNDPKNSFLYIAEANEILDVEIVIASILLVDNLRIQKN